MIYKTTFVKYCHVLIFFFTNSAKIIPILLILHSSFLLFFHLFFSCPKVNFGLSGGQPHSILREAQEQMTAVSKSNPVVVVLWV